MLILLAVKGKEGEVETGTRVAQPQQVVASSFPSWDQVGMMLVASWINAVM